jgi:hypothetical protein
MGKGMGLEVGHDVDGASGYRQVWDVAFSSWVEHMMDALRFCMARGEAVMRGLTTGKS